MKSSLILTGGRGIRLGCKEKALIPIKGRTILEHIIGELEQAVDEIIISARDDEQKRILEEYTHGRKIVTDRYSDVGPLAGILEGLKSAHGEYMFVTACDMPNLNSAVVRLLFDRARGHDAALPVWEDQKLEPLHSVYRVNPMVYETEKAIQRGDRFVLAPLFKMDDVVYVDMDEIRQIDPDLKTFMNINTAEDIVRLVEA
jgi:molybdopterin-guanine dinucleotide biosynthesis protein A